ncbi:MAG: cytochrome c family protein [Emcibacteraceae bacterium]|nr:cytochrome c family protein [Emcibacteraceae bacterium]
MNSQDLNKLAMGFLIAILGMMGFNMLSEEVFHQAPLTANAYPIDTSAVASASVADVAVEAGPSIEELLQTASMDKGMTVFKKCAACHTTASGDRNKIGPNLFNDVGRDVATNGEFGYSDAMLAQEGGWSYELLNRYLTKPKDAIPGNKMVFVGLKKGSDRASVILYLRSLSDAPIDLPAVAAVEEVVEEVMDGAVEAATDAM